MARVVWFWAGIETAEGAIGFWGAAAFLKVYERTMVRPTRNKKPVNYSQFQNSDSDDDFIPTTVPPNKKSKIIQKELKQDKPKPNVKSLQKEDILPEKTPKKRVALDDKVFQRGLEVALALSVKECPAVPNQEQPSQEKSTEKQGRSKTETVTASPRASNCSVASGHIEGLEEVVEEENTCGVHAKRQAAPKAEAQQRRALLEGGTRSSTSDSEPDDETGKDSDDSDLDESGGSDGDFTVRKSKVKKKQVKRKSLVEKKQKKPKSKCSASVTSGAAPPVIQSEAPSSPKAVSLSSETTRKPAKMCSPLAEGKRPKWVPPAASGSTSARYSSSSPLVGASKSPSQSLRLGLSRLARVKPLHPNATSSQVW